MTKREFTVACAHAYDQRDAVRWIVAHLARYKRLAVFYMLISVLANVSMALVTVVVGNSFNDVLHGASGYDDLVHAAQSILGLVLLTGAFDLGARSVIEYLGKRLSRDARDELYVSLLGKSQTFIA